MLHFCFLFSCSGIYLLLFDLFIFFSTFLFKFFFSLCGHDKVTVADEISSQYICNLTAVNVVLTSFYVKLCLTNILSA